MEQKVRKGEELMGKMKEYYDKLLSFNKKLDSEDEPEI